MVGRKSVAKLDQHLNERMMETGKANLSIGKANLSGELEVWIYQHGLLPKPSILATNAL
jgi:hypothetical protein